MKKLILAATVALASTSALASGTSTEVSPNGETVIPLERSYSLNQDGLRYNDILRWENNDRSQGQAHSEGWTGLGASVLHLGGEADTQARLVAPQAVHLDGDQWGQAGVGIYEGTGFQNGYNVYNTNNVDGTIYNTDNPIGAGAAALVIQKFNVTGEVAGRTVEAGTDGQGRVRIGRVLAPAGNLQ